MNRRRAGVLLMLFGALLLLSAALLASSNQREEAHAEEKAEAALLELRRELLADSGQPILPQGAQQSASPDAASSEAEESLSPEMPTLQIDGQDYIGYLELPTLGLSLPVMSEWSELKLQTAPCRYWGTIQDGTLVILAHNHARHFGRLKELGIGDPAQFVDANGMVYPYEVAAIETLEPDEVNRMVDSEYDLTLFTCTYGGKHRVTVRLNRTKNLL